MTRFNEALGLDSDVLIIDTDTHLTEPADLWTSRAPAKYADRVPRVEQIDGRDTWVFDGQIIGGAGTSSAIAADGEKLFGMTFIGLGYDAIHRGAWDIAPRLEFMDEQGIWAQIVYPNTFGFGGQRFISMEDATLRLLAVQLFNDAMAEMQELSGDRLFAMAITPWWDVDETVAEIRRSRRWAFVGSTPGPARTCTGCPISVSPIGTRCGMCAPSCRCR